MVIPQCEKRSVGRLLTHGHSPHSCLCTTDASPELSTTSASKILHLGEFRGTNQTLISLAVEQCQHRDPGGGSVAVLVGRPRFHPLDPLCL